MMNFIQKYLYPKKINRKEFFDYFLSIPEHYWIDEKNGFQKNHFEKLFNILPASLIHKIISEHPVSFVLSKDLNRFSPNQIYKNTIIVFPEFQKLLIENKGAALAYLAHELALLMLELEGDSKNDLANEVAADKFVSDLGLVFELEAFLLMLDESVEKRMRLTYLTINHVSDL